MKPIKIIAFVIWLFCLAVLIWITIQVRKANKPVKTNTGSVIYDSTANQVISGWFARDKGGTLWFYSQKPYRYGAMWICDEPSSSSLITLPLFPHLRWEDDPIEIEITVKKK